MPQFLCSMMVFDVCLISCHADVIGCLEAALEGSGINRSRKQIVNQLMKQCLVDDRKQVYKKAPNKKKVSNCLEWAGGVRCDG